MYVVKKLRKNPFKVAFLPKPKDLFARVGIRPAGGAFSGTDPNNLRVVAHSVRKLDSLAYVDSLDMRELYNESMSQTEQKESEIQSVQNETDSSS